MKTFTQKLVKKAFLFSIFFSLFSAQAQAPQKMSYQAVIRNASNALVTNTPVAIKVSILGGSATGVVFFVERHTTTTNANGLASLEIGTGTIISGSFPGIIWDFTTYFVKTETDPSGGTNYTISATNQLLSVPYALSSADNKWSVSGNNIGNNNSANVGIGTTTPNAKLEVNGFTKLGSEAPAIKVKKITGLTGSTQGGEVTLFHNIDINKILSVNVLVNFNGITLLPPMFQYILGTTEYNYFLSASNITIKNSPANSADILSKPVTVLITYEE